MYDTLVNQNAFLMQADSERLAAHRLEIKRGLAEITVKKARLVDLKNIVQKLRDDSDRAASEHSAAAGLLQSELDELDRQQIESVLADTASPPESIERRRQILDELTKLNQTLETTCEANRRAAKPIEKQIHALTLETTSETSLQNQLVRLCSVDLRRQMMLVEHKMQIANLGVKEADRVAKICEHNRNISEMNRNPSDAAIQIIKRDDSLWLVGAMQREGAELRAESERLRQQALSE